MQEMEKTGVDFCLDVHGDEALPYNFIAGAEGVPSFTKQGQKWLDDFQASYKTHSPDFQTKFGYGITPKGKANLSMATNQIAERFGAVAMTLEMPFKDNRDAPDDRQGWSPERSMQLARECLATLAEMVEEI